MMTPTPLDLYGLAVEHVPDGGVQRLGAIEHEQPRAEASRPRSTALARRSRQAVLFSVVPCMMPSRHLVPSASPSKFSFSCPWNARKIARTASTYSRKRGPAGRSQPRSGARCGP